MIHLIASRPYELTVEPVALGAYRQALVGGGTTTLLGSTVAGAHAAGSLSRESCGI